MTGPLLTKIKFLSGARLRPPVQVREIGERLRGGKEDVNPVIRREGVVKLDT